MSVACALTDTLTSGQHLYLKVQIYIAKYIPTFQTQEKSKHLYIQLTSLEQTSV